MAHVCGKDDHTLHEMPADIIEVIPKIVRLARDCGNKLEAGYKAVDKDVNDIKEKQAKFSDFK